MAWKNSYYSVVLGGAIHLVDLLLWLSNEIPEEVTAYGNRITSRNTAFRHNDMVVALIRMKSGVIAKVSANFGCCRPHFHSVEVYGHQRTFINRPGSAEIYTTTSKGVKPELMNTPYYDYQKPDLIMSFINCILGKGPPIVTIDDIYRTMATCFAIENAVSSGLPTHVKY